MAPGAPVAGPALRTSLAQDAGHSQVSFGVTIHTTVVGRPRQAGIRISNRVIAHSPDGDALRRAVTLTAVTGGKPASPVSLE